MTARWQPAATPSRALPLAFTFVLPLVSTLALALAGNAAAHGDGLVIDEPFELAAGETLVRPFVVHYHRLIGSLEADAPIRVRVLGPDGQLALPPVEGVRIDLNALIPCCDAAWSPHQLVLEAAGPTAVAGRARLHVLHDDVAVMTYGAEAGTTTSQLLLLLLWLPVLAAIRRRRHDWRRHDWRPALPIITRAFPWLLTLGAALAAWGAFRYGGGVVGGFLAAFVDLPFLPLNAWVSRPSLAIFLAFLVSWIAAVVGWSRTAPSARRWTAHGALLAVAPIVVAALVTSTYGAQWRPWLMAALASTPVLAGLLLTPRREEG